VSFRDKRRPERVPRHANVKSMTIRSDQSKPISIMSMSYEFAELRVCIARSTKSKCAVLWGRSFAVKDNGDDDFDKGEQIHLGSIISVVCPSVYTSNDAQDRVAYASPTLRAWSSKVVTNWPRATRYRPF
jgi:hypothetical protein